MNDLLLTFYPSEPIKIKIGINVLTIEDPFHFYNFCQQLQIDNDKTILSRDNKILPLEKFSVYFGDITLFHDLNKIYNKLINDTFVNNLDEFDLKEIFDLTNKVNNVFNKVILDKNLPFSFSSNFDISDLVKDKKIQVNPLTGDRPYDKFRSIIELSSELSDPRMLIFTNSLIYLSKAELAELITFASQMERNVLFLERFESKIDVPEAAANYFFDKDFTIF
ncbi:type II-A CRISPR-associated protein Csn2 [Oenococcus alcoholitolerans]|uniref:type II-A CRISPR-associated protein Csn2 n=1 Tax=Oenococcus alcoholitolerans TaxID=931074 RepID=UPI003F6ED6EB